MRVVVEDAKLEIVRACDEPILAGYEADAAYGNLRDLKRLNQGTRFVVVDIDRAIVETGEDPGLCWMKVDSFYAIRASEEFPLVQK